MVGGSGPLSRRIGYRDDRAKFRVKSLELPALMETTGDFYHSLESSEYPPSSWPCRACTFVNSGWLPQCEMCESPVNAPATSNDSSSANLVQVAIDETAITTKGGDWPSLRDALHSFVDCEISSVGSSWLEIGDTEVVLEEGDVSIVHLSEQPAPPSWAARAKGIAANGPAATLPSAGVALPPPLQKTHAAKHAESDKEAGKPDDENWDLLCLEDRRLHPTFDRGSTRRRRRCG